MNSFTKDRVVKRHEVAFTHPRLVERPDDEFACLSTRLPFLSSVPAQADSADLTLFSPERTQVAEENEERARVIVAEAELAAKELLARAQHEREHLREEFTIRLREEIRAEAYTDGYQAGLGEGLQAAEKVQAEAYALLDLAQRALDSEYIRAQEQLLGLSLKIAERITRSELSMEPKKILNIIHELALLPQEQGEWRLHLAPNDWEWVVQLPTGEQLPYSLVKDETLRPGDCFLECQEGLFDARLDSQLDKLEQHLREELAHGKLEQID